MTKIENRYLKASVFLSVVLLASQNASAMHIMEGYLPPAYCIFWGALCIPFLTMGVIKIRHTVQEQRKSLLLLAMSGAFIFVISSLKIPSATGSCSHMTGTGLVAILFGPFHAAVLGIIVLLFQAILLAHGGLTSIGANTFSMAIAGPILSWAIYTLCKKAKVNRKTGIFLAASLGDLFSYCVTAMELAIAYPSPQGGVAANAVKFLGIFAATQIPLAIIEGMLTVIIIIGMESYARPELRALGFVKEAE
ncbi:MAG: energy-coupling factor ABC transporter permease [Angelakisella sp.]